MKKIVIPFLAFIVLFAVGCKKDPTKPILGKWQLDKSTYTTLDQSNVIDDTPTTSLEYVYEKDGTGSLKYGGIDKLYRFQWYLSEDLGEITFVGESGNGSSYDIETLSDEKMVLNTIVQLDTTSTNYTYRAEYSKIGK